MRLQGMSVGRAYELLLGQCCVIVVDRISGGSGSRGVGSVRLQGERPEDQGRFPLWRASALWSFSPVAPAGQVSRCRPIFAIPFALFASSRT